MKIRNTSFTQTRVLYLYNQFIDKATQMYNLGKLDKSINYIMMAARWMYFFNVLYYDKNIESLIYSISKSIIKTELRYTPDNNCVVFLDSICTTKCLSVQYLRALMASRKKIVYILHHNIKTANEVISLLDNYDNKTICVLDSKYSYSETAIRINNIIKEHVPSKIFLHMWAHDVVSLIGISNVKSAIKYNIDLQDHTFWLGSSFIDYDIVFRDYGEKIALEKRHFKESQIIRLPYYPLINISSNFLGFPIDKQESTLAVFTGGATYKMLGKNDKFFELLQIIINKSENIHILIATSESDILNEKIRKIKSNERIHLIGMRKDIDEVFKHSDIYLSTYPFIGGLMSQYAAACELPVLAYAEENEPNVTEGLINHKFNAVSSQRSIKAFSDYAEKLIFNKKFRISEGKKNKEAIFTEDDFNKYFEKVLNLNSTCIKWHHKENPNYDEMIKFYIENENKYSHLALSFAISCLRFNVFFFYYKEFLSIIQLIVKTLSNKLKKYIRN